MFFIRRLSGVSRGSTLIAGDCTEQFSYPVSSENPTPGPLFTGSCAALRGMSFSAKSASIVLRWSVPFSHSLASALFSVCQRFPRCAPVRGEGERAGREGRRKAARAERKKNSSSFPMRTMRPLEPSGPQLWALRDGQHRTARGSRACTFLVSRLSSVPLSVSRSEESSAAARQPVRWT